MHIEPLSNDDLGAHIDVSSLRPGDGSYEWWYFEITFIDEGVPWRLVTSFHYPHAFDPTRLAAVDGAGIKWLQRTRDPGEYAGVVTNVMRGKDNVARFIDKLNPAGMRTSRGGEPMKLGFSSRARIEEISRDPLELRVQLSQRWRARWLEYDVTFKGYSPGFRPKGGVLLEDACHAEHHWVVPMPNAITKIHHLGLRTYDRGRRIDLKIGQQAGGGYHDHQWGPALPHHRIFDWSWGRVGLEPPGPARVSDQLLFFQSRRAAGAKRIEPDKRFTPAPILVLIPGDGGTPRSIHPPPGARGIHLEKRVRDWHVAANRLRYYSRIRLEGVDPGSEEGRSAAPPRSLSLRLEQNNDREVDTWPIYKRFLPEVHPSEGVTEAISEYLQPIRLNDRTLLRGFRIASLGKTVAEDGSPGR